MKDKALVDAFYSAIADTRSDAPLSGHQALKVLDEIRIHMQAQSGSDAARIASTLHRAIYGVQS